MLRRVSAVSSRLDVTQQARPVCESLAARLGETVNIAVRRPHFVVNIDQARRPAAVGTHNRVGKLSRTCSATSSGKVLLAYMGPEQRRNVLRTAGLCCFTTHTITALTGLSTHVEKAAGDGYACTVEEFEEGRNAIAAPV